jgi:hypothetical protein
MESICGKENSRNRREKVRFVSDEEAIVGVPAIVVGKLVDVRVPMTIIVIAIHVADRDASCAAPSITPMLPLSIEYSPDCI